MRSRRISIICVTTFTLTASGIASAADMAVKAPPPAPIYNWTGWYAGFNFGGGFGTSNNATTTSTSVADGLAQFFPGTTPSGSTAGANAGVAGLNQSGPIGGVQFGYNFQLNPLFVFGFEADIQGAAITGRDDNTGTSTESFAGTSSYFKSVTIATSAEAVAASFTNAAITAAGSDLVTADLNWLGTARLRAGYLVTPNLLLYATGGLAYGGVSASDSATLNFGNLTADSFALAYGQANGTTPSVTVSPTTGGPNPMANSTVTAGTGAATAFSMASANITGNTPNAAPIAIGNFSGATAAQTSSNPLNAIALATSSSVAGPITSSTISYTQTTKPLSVALATTTQSFAHVSDTKYGGTIGGGFEWMMAPNWSVKAEALYYDLGSVTVSAPLTASINPLTAPIPATVGVISTAGVSSAINKLVGPATVSNAASTRVTFQGVIIRLGLNYHFNLL
jgi:opacity protein-like surface antigen